MAYSNCRFIYIAFSKNAIFRIWRIMKQILLDKFVRYAKIDTQSDPFSPTCPSTAKQFDLAKVLVAELQEMGYSDAYVNEKCYTYATIPSNIPATHPAFGKVPAIGFVSHVDTSPDTTATGCNPQIHENYNGQDITLGDSGIIIKFDENPALKNCIGHTIVTTDGTTLLGSDDKSGITAIMTLAQHLKEHPELLHGDIKICFTPDEEIGRGADLFDIKTFDCKYAYTIDGEMPGELNKETFSADAAIIRAWGRDIHPGSAKDIMVNSMRAMAEIITRMPKDMAPETTEGYEPYLHPHKFEGSIFKSELYCLLRDFKSEGLRDLEAILRGIIDEVQALYPKTKIELEIKYQYRNMLDKLEADPIGLDHLFEAATRAGANPYWHPIRGGTDGSRLTEMGLPCPNIFTGGQNFHSKTEWLSVDALELAVKTMIELCQVWVEAENK